MTEEFSQDFKRMRLAEKRGTLLRPLRVSVCIESWLPALFVSI
jgi:hypothetical protein